jgi:hypothetical protein
LCACLVLGARTASAQNAVINGDFETGDWSGWQLFASQGSKTGSFGPLLNPAYSFPLTTTPLMDQIGVNAGCGMGSSHGLEAFNWQLFGPGTAFQGPDSNTYMLNREYYTLGVYQDVSLTAGATLTGWARFRSVDYPLFSDCASVSVNGTSVWYYDLPTLGYPTGVVEDRMGPWQSWSFTAPTNGTYRLSLSVYGDDQHSSWAYFDNIQVVPEPGVISIMALAIGLVLARVRFSRST